ncbi:MULTISPECIES: FtsX-like permease family protein [Bacillus cereus group]|uniref:FtsX-like permease family protein n=1 Tax=Bacillus cereus group TaxID=86661 RepID=UPI000BEC6663|nr:MULTISPECIES: FtsX-like permease family protein [Bacillus cereus group]PEB95467.1 ABC transporter permease [Bacillus cereus]PEC24100.1 ABC transporter permease [Bacillus thuringiensis]PEQ69964.1 ABC transporter permease [Bacillus cereus]PFR33283.1 ABC transporter permease [Bacillus cereus]PFW21850.1 ABC transporter permease [Bacillus cereus]
MTLRSLAFSSIRSNWRSYSAFFMSSVFSVMVFYMYAAFVAHPILTSSHMIGTSKVRLGMMLCQYIIVIFSLLFVLYSNSAFLKSRSKEFGLLYMVGMTRMQLRRLIVYESTIIAVMAIVAGISLGILFSKPFFMSLAVLLGMKDSIAVAIPLHALWLTAGGFFMLFTFISIGTAIRIGRTEIVELLNTGSRSEEQMVYSPWRALLAVVCLAFSYGMALMLNATNFNKLVLVILLTAITGTYLFFTQFSVLLLRFIKSSTRVYYNRTNLIVFAQLGLKLKENARMLFVVSILSAVILTASGTIYMLGLAVQLDNIKTQYEDAQGVISLTMFIGVFISLLFFVASGSMIYFKLFTDLQEDQAQYKALTRIGMTQAELWKIVYMQVGILFFAPCLVGIIHTLVALKALNNLLMVSNWIYSFVIIGIYMVMQMIYFLVACNSYMKSINLTKGNRL